MFRPEEIFLAEVFVAELAGFPGSLLNLVCRAFPPNPALSLETAGLWLGVERPQVTAGLVGSQAVRGGGEGAAQVVVGAGKVGQHLHQPVGGLGEALGGPVHVHPADGAGVAPGPAGGTQGVAIGAAGHRGAGDDTQADWALQ